MKKLLVVVIALAVCAGAQIARAENCDPGLKGLEYYSCTLGNKEFEIGLKKGNYRVCTELKKLKPAEGCLLGPFSPAKENQIVYIVGKAAQKDKFNETSWQCDNLAGSGTGGMKPTTFEGNWHPDYTIDKYPGEDNSARNKKFKADLEKQGKAVLGAFGVYEPVNEYSIKFNKQTCQFFNAKANTIAAKFTANIGSPGKAAAGSLATGGAEKSEKTDVKKGLKKVLGK